MTSSHLDDETLSAAIDGEATDAEQAHVTACPVCQQRAEAFRTVARAVGGPVPPRQAAEVDAAIQAALDGAVEPESEGALPAAADGQRAPRPAAASVGSLELVPARRNPRILAVAAALVVIVGGAGLVGVLSRSSSPAKTSTASRLPAQGGQSIDTAAGANRSAPPAAPVGGAIGTPGQLLPYSGEHANLGSQADPVALARLVNGQIDATGVGQFGTEAGAASAGAASAGPAQPPCLEQGRTASGLAGQQAPLRYAAPLQWRGVDAVVLVFDRPNGGRAGVVMARTGCAPLASLPV
jgi:hypothetical protein